MDIFLAQSTKVTVFKIANDSLREFYVGTTSKPMAVLMAAVRRALPRAIRHWKMDHQLHFRSVEFGLQRDAADAFLRNYILTLKRVGWRVIAEPPAISQKTRRR